MTSPNNFKWKFNSKKLREAREILSLTQESLALKMGISRQAYNAWETGATTPKISSLIKVCGILGIKPEIFFNEVDNDRER